MHTLAAKGDIVLAACWAHARRKFYEFHQATGSPIAAEVLRRIAGLYAIEREIRGQSAAERQGTRDTRSRPLVDAMKPWLEVQLRRVPPRGALAEAIRYALARWPALCRFLDDGRVELDTNPAPSAPSGPWRSGARTIWSPAPMAAESDGQWSAPSSPRQGSTTSSPIA